MAIHTTVKCIGGWIEKPLEDVGNTTHKIYRLKCIVDAGSYSLTSLNATKTMTSVAVAEIDQLPNGIAVDSSAYFVGDSTTQPISGTPFVEFIRSFATVPSSYSRVEGTVTYTFPEYREWYDFGTNNQTKADINVPALPTPPILLKKARTLAVPARATYTFSYRTDAGVGIAQDDLYDITQIAQTDTGQSWSLNQPTVVGVGYVCNSDTNGTLTLYGTHTTGESTTEGDLSDYESYVSDEDYLTISSSIGRYMGNIYFKKTLEVIAQ